MLSDCVLGSELVFRQIVRELRNLDSDHQFFSLILEALLLKCGLAAELT